jgi:hypothetical protein
MELAKAKNVQRPKYVIVRVTAIERQLWREAAQSRELDVSKMIRQAVKLWMRGDGYGAPST